MNDQVDKLPPGQCEKVQEGQLRKTANIEGDFRADLEFSEQLAALESKWSTGL